MAEKKVKHILGISGGKDSTALAVLLHKEIPEMEYFFVIPIKNYRKLTNILTASKHDWGLKFIISVKTEALIIG